MTIDIHACILSIKLKNDPKVLSLRRGIMIVYQKKEQ